MSTEQEFWEHLGEKRPDDNARVGGRICQESVASSLGPVLDLSARGARIMASGNPRGRINLTLCDPQCELTLPCEVIWSRRRGFFKHEIGVCFVDLTEEQAKQLAHITMQNRIERIYHGRDRAA